MNSAVAKHAKKKKITPHIKSQSKQMCRRTFSLSGVQKLIYSDANKVHFSPIKSIKTKRKPFSNKVTLKLINTYSLLIMLEFG